MEIIQDIEFITLIYVIKYKDLKKEKWEIFAKITKKSCVKISEFNKVINNIEIWKNIRIL